MCGGCVQRERACKFFVCFNLKKKVHCKSVQSEQPENLEVLNTGNYLPGCRVIILKNPPSVALPKLSESTSLSVIFSSTA